MITLSLLGLWQSNAASSSQMMKALCMMVRSSTPTSEILTERSLPQLNLLKKIHLLIAFEFGPSGRGQGEGDKAWDEETMFSQLANGSTSQWFLERVGKFLMVISPANAAQVQC